MTRETPRWPGANDARGCMGEKHQDGPRAFWLDLWRLLGVGKGMADGHGTDWVTILTAVGGGGVLTHLFGWLTGRRKAEADARKVDAEAKQIDAEGDRALEGILNDRVRLILDGFKTQIDELTSRLQRQEKDCREREERLLSNVERLEAEIQALRKALDERPRPGPIPIGL